jgi:hypothetical protein
MPKESYWKDVYHESQRELELLRAERDERKAELQELNEDILRIEELARHLLPFASDIAESPTVVVAEGLAKMKLADACREVLKQTAHFRTAKDVRDSLEAGGYDLKQHNNALASIHGILKRFQEAGAVEQLESGGKTRYRWTDLAKKTDKK